MIKRKELKKICITAILLHESASLRGDHKTANKQYNILSTIYKKIKGSNQEKLFYNDLLKHSNPSVRLWASSHLLPLDEQKSKKILKTLLSSGGIIGLDAEMTLKEWEKGNLKFDT